MPLIRRPTVVRQHYLYCLDFPNGKRYIGKTDNLRRRLAWHDWTARNTNRNLFVLVAIRKYGLPQPTVLCVGDRNYIAQLEGKAIVAFRTHLAENGYNKLIAGIPWNKGAPRTAKDRAAIKAGLDASEKTQGARQKLVTLNKSRIGIPISAEARAKLSAATKGRPKSIETRRKMSEAAYRRHARDRGETPYNQLSTDHRRASGYR